MTRPKAARYVPKLGKHSTGRGRVRLNGQTHYSPDVGKAAINRWYRELVERWEAGGRQPLKTLPRTVVQSGPIKLSKLRDLFLAQLESDGASCFKDGKRTSQYGLLERALTELIETTRDVRTSQFTEAMLVRHRDRLMSSDRERVLTVGGINRKVQLIRQVFTWGRSRGFVSTEVCSALGFVKGLRASKCGDRPQGVRKYVPSKEDASRAVSCASSVQVRTMMRLQWLTGMRPGEVCAMRWVDIDQESGDVNASGDKCWRYVVVGAKTSHHGTETSYLLNRQCQELLEAFQDRLPNAFLFSPAEVNEASEHPTRDRVFESRYTTVIYRQAVKRACQRAEVKVFSPHALRHAFASILVNESGLPITACQAALNHTSLQATLGYVKADKSARLAVAAFQQKQQCI